MKTTLRQLIQTVLGHHRAKAPRRRPPLCLELLEQRLAPANLDIDAAGAAILTGAPGELNAFTLFLNSVTDRYEFTDSNPVTFSGAGSGAAFADCQNAGPNTVTAKNAFIVSITLA